MWLRDQLGDGFHLGAVLYTGKLRSGSTTGSGRCPSAPCGADPDEQAVRLRAPDGVIAAWAASGQSKATPLQASLFGGGCPLGWPPPSLQGCTGTAAGSGTACGTPTATCGSPLIERYLPRGTERSCSGERGTALETSETRWPINRPLAPLPTGAPAAAGRQGSHSVLQLRDELAQLPVSWGHD